jgi:hypothetical protein
MPDEVAGRDEKTPRQPNQKTEGRKKRKNIERNRSNGIDTGRPVTEARLIQRISLYHAKSA